MFHILVVEDDESTRKLVRAVLEKNGYTVFTAENGVKALETLGREHIDLIVLDIMMPEMDGFTLTRELRECGYQLPILMATARRDLEDKEEGFQSGADDYMTKPIEIKEMLLRIQALLRRSQIVNERSLTIGEVRLDYDTLTVTRGEETHTLRQKEFYLLYKLLSNPGRIFTRIQLMDEIWGMDSDTLDTTVNVHINRLRRHFEHCPEFELVTVRGLGYKAVKKV